jgi:hypothetical protein
LLCHASYGVMPLSALVGTRFRRWTAVTTTSPQNRVGSLYYFSRARAMTTTIWFLLSMMLFFCSE